MVRPRATPTDGHITELKEGADALGGFNAWLSKRTDQYQAAGILGQVGAAFTGVTRGVVGMAEIGLRGVNYAANGISMLAATATGQGNSSWAQAHAAEVQQSNSAMANVGSYLANGGMSDIASKTGSSLLKAANGDVAAIGNVAEFATGFAGGGSGEAMTVANISAKAARVAEAVSSTARTAQVVTRALVTDTLKTASSLTGEAVNGIKASGVSILEGAGGRLNPLNYTTEGFGSLGGNIRYRPRGGGVSAELSLKRRCDLFCH